ncbi:MAG: acyltransferase [Isosphaeraceae bacterium]|nr:acyltransferase [Isosphaeraceae bacterium]
MQTGSPIAEKPRRLLGIDLLRGLAAYAVVVIHSFGHIERTATALAIGRFCIGFAVPFFLAAAYAFSIPKILADGGRGLIRTRLRRLVVPYLVWTAIYTALRSVISLERGAWYLRVLYYDPLGLLLLGEAAVHLYFVPLLIVGELVAIALIGLLGPWARRPVPIALLSIAAFALSIADPFGALARRPPYLVDPLIHLTVVLADFVVWSLPYIVVGLCLGQEPVRRRLSHLRWPHGLLLLAMALGLAAAATIRGPVLPHLIQDVVIANALLLSAVAISPYLRPSRWIDSLGICAFGIYLIHHAVLEVIERATAAVPPLRGAVGDAPRLLASAGLVFAVSWLLVALGARIPTLARIAFGIEPRPRPGP